MKRVAPAAPFLAALLLAGCSGGAPGEGDMRTALTAAGNRGGAKAVLLACQRSPERPGYVCDYRAPACNRFTGTCGAERAFTGRFVHAGGKWQQVEDLSARAPLDPATVPLPGVVLASPTPAAARPPVAETIPAAEPAPARTPDELSRDERRAIARWRALDAACRAGEGYEVEDACAEREAIGEALSARALCYDSPGGYGYERAWRRCEG